jgi:hypothetical protein
MSVSDIWLTTSELCKLAKDSPNDILFFIGVKVDWELYNDFQHRKKLKEFEEMGLINQKAEEVAFDFAHFLDKVTDYQGVVQVILANDSKTSVSYITADYERKSRKRKYVSFRADPFLRYLVRVPADLLAKVKPRIVKRIMKLGKMHNFPLYVWDPAMKNCKIIVDWSVD